MGGGVAPPAIRQTTEPILDPKTAFDSFGLEISEYIAKFYVTSLMTSQVGSKLNARRKTHEEMDASIDSVQFQSIKINLNLILKKTVLVTTIPAHPHFSSI